MKPRDFGALPGRKKQRKDKNLFFLKIVSVMMLANLIEGKHTCYSRLMEDQQGHGRIYALAEETEAPTWELHNEKSGLNPYLKTPLMPD